MATEDIQTNLRLPGELKERLQQSAEEAGRSLSAEVAYRVSRGFELERVVEALRADFDVAQRTMAKMATEIDIKSRQLGDTDRRMVTMEGELRFLKTTRESDIAAATKFLSERVDFLAERAAAAEREAQALRGAALSYERHEEGIEKTLDAQAGLVQVMAQFVISAVDMAGPQPGVTNEIFKLMKETAEGVKSGQKKSIKEPVEYLMVMLMAVNELPPGRDLQEFVNTVLKHYREARAVSTAPEAVPAPPDGDQSPRPNKAVVLKTSAIHGKEKTIQVGVRKRRTPLGFPKPPPKT